ncbi:hypothetical protein E2562_016929 [Oryza meyeriana var. granulata]|uniref:SOSEKI DIX-like domain-containing protein n=1 Tax=Oryza meyeriana var. granulata TaxID=110450 RepID=A0A6G1DWX8_9ORYZ|nr:hypothetical protein E2562_016929 [Oryza meyeriana var. granulata]
MEKGGGSQKGGGGGEVRRINVVYFLSRGGRTDHPHLFRVNHLPRVGVRLRDVKRWLSELRGKDMPDNFSWSYKRKYKAGYIWLDLMDDDLITPISDNEYVLKGCDVRRAPPPCTEAPKEKSSSLAEEPKELNSQKEKVARDQKQVEVVIQVTTAPDSDERSSKTPPPADQYSAGGESGPAPRRTVPFKNDLSRDLHDENTKQQQQQQEAVKSFSKAVVARSAPAGEKVKGAAGGRISNHPPAVGRARRMHLAQLLHNILTCGAADADDTALRPVLRQSVAGAADDDWPSTPVCPGIDGCGLRVSKKVKVRRGGKEKAKQKRDGGKRDGGDAHKPASLPRCSQCGKEFKPQELHSHMQSCRVFRERMRSSTSSRVSVDRSRSSAAARTSSKFAAGDTSERPSAALLLRDS